MKSAAGFIKPTPLFRRKLSALTIAAFVSFSSGIMADDTEIFFGQATNQPNVLFILDISGSMGFTDGTSTSPGPTRLRRLKDALNEILSTASNINVGLLTFGGNYHRMLREIAPVTENRDQLLTTVENLIADGGTPTVGALYRGAQYYRGEAFRESASAPLVTYNNPMVSQCQSNHIVLLTDGDPTVDQASVRAVENAIFPANSGLRCTNPSGLPGGKCGAELATWLADTDHSPTLEDSNNVVTHTIGFNFSKSWLATVSTAGSGQHFDAETSADLVEAFDSILEDAVSSGRSFAAPAITIDQFTRFSNRDDMYLALFQPGSSQRWSGNLKKYKFNGVIKDQNNAAAFDATTGSLYPTAHSFWSENPDGAAVTSGGAANEIDADNRNLYTYLGTNAALSDPSNSLHEDGPVTAALLNVPTDERTNLLRWARGVDVYDEDSNPATTARNHMGDPLHSRPAILTYGGTQANPESAVFIGTNDGYLHAIDSRNGAEIFSFVPPELLGNLDIVYDDKRTLNRIYGIDGDLTLWVNDQNNDGVLQETNEHAYLYMGMRRGGDFYYALDVTEKNEPEYLWSIKNGDTGFEKLGQSWSKPTLSKVSINGTLTDVLIFGGGYDGALDNSNFRSADTVGNDLYIVNASTGALIWNTSTPTDTAPYDGIMQYSMPSDPKVIDINGDGMVDQIYIGDMGGQVWRFDVDSNATSAAALVSGGVIANLAGNTPANNRRFFYPPDVALVDNGSGSFLSVSIGSGNRANPLGTGVNDRFYMIRQNSTSTAPEGYGMIDTAASTASNTVYRPITDADLYNATQNLIGSSDVTIASTAAETLKSKQGWRLSMQATGEKVLAASLTVNNQIVFSTYLPEYVNADICSPTAGAGRIYKVQVIDATPITGNAHNDRFQQLSATGIPAQPTPFISSNGDLTILVGTETVDPPVFKPTKRVYWTEQPDY